MPIEIISAYEAGVNASRKEARWPENNKDSRLKPFVSPEFQPSFEITEKDNIFCMGSCFARNIETALYRFGFECVSMQVNNPYAQGAWGQNNFFVRYNPFAMLNEFKWALDENCPFPQDAFLEVEKDLWMDPYHHTHNENRSLEQTQKLRQLIIENTKRVKECRVLILTLGLVEAWYDNELKIYTNLEPHRSYMKKYPSRFSLHVLSYEEVLSALNQIYELLNVKGHPDFKILITTSPVPLAGTFRKQSIFCANMYSKNVLRAAIEQFQIQYENVNYFPSYESVLLSKNKFVWEKDLRHVHQEIVRFNITRMLQAYIAKSSPSYSKIKEPFKIQRRTKVQWKKISKKMRNPLKIALQKLGVRGKIVELSY